MSKLSISGILLVAIAGVMLVFQKIAGLMGESGGYDAVCIVDLVDPKHLDWIDGMTFMSINNLLDTIVLAPLYILLFCVGAVLLIISGFKK